LRIISETGNIASASSVHSEITNITSKTLSTQVGPWLALCDDPSAEASDFARGLTRPLQHASEPEKESGIVASEIPTVARGSVWEWSLHFTSQGREGKRKKQACAAVPASLVRLARRDHGGLDTVMMKGPLSQQDRDLLEIIPCRICI
jgi:hypothetical protein